MNAQKAVGILAEHLLGKDWSITDPMSTEQANVLITDEIMSRYKSIDESPINRWRRSRANRRCKFCKNYTSYKCIGRGIVDEKGNCNAKDRVVNGNVHRPFCTVFQLKPFYETEEK